MIGNDDARNANVGVALTATDLLRHSDFGLPSTFGIRYSSFSMTQTTGAPRSSDKRDPLTEEFLRYLANERNASPRTLKAYRQALTAFRAEMPTPWKKCRADDFCTYLFAIAKGGQARSYVRLQFS